MKSLPITNRAKRSPLKEADSFLVRNDAQTHNQFVDVASDYAAGRKEGLKMTKSKYEEEGIEEKK